MLSHAMMTTRFSLRLCAHYAATAERVSLGRILPKSHRHFRASAPSRAERCREASQAIASRPAAMLTEGAT